MGVKEIVKNHAMKSFYKLIIAALGIFLCYFCYGLLHERITRKTYGDGDEQDRFAYFQALVGFLCLFNYVVAQGRSERNILLLYISMAKSWEVVFHCSNVAYDFLLCKTKRMRKCT